MNQRDNKPLQLNGHILAACKYLKPLAASATESELGGLYYNVQDCTVLILMLDNIRQPQASTTPIYFHNTMAIINEHALFLGL